MEDLSVRLEGLFLAWRKSLEAAQAAEMQFKGVAALIHGPDATWEYNEKTGLRFVRPNHQSSDTSRRQARKSG